MSAYLGIPRCDSVNIENALDINWDQISRAADGMIYNHGKDALAEAERRAQSLRSAGCYSGALTWESICELIQNRIGRHTRVECTTDPKLSQPGKLRGVEATLGGFFCPDESQH